MLEGITLECVGDGSRVDLAAALAGKPVLLNLWGLLVRTVREELPYLQQYADRAGSAVTVLTVHTDPNEANALARLAEYDVHLPGVQDGSARVQAAVGSPAVLPVSVLIRPDGTVAKILPQPFRSVDEIADVVQQYSASPHELPIASAAEPRGRTRVVARCHAHPARGPQPRQPVLDRRAPDGAAVRPAAVLVLFGGSPESDPLAVGGLPADADVLLTQRASTMRQHSGQVAFPAARPTRRTTARRHGSARSRGGDRSGTQRRAAARDAAAAVHPAVRFDVTPCSPTGAIPARSASSTWPRPNAWFGCPCGT